MTLLEDTMKQGEQLGFEGRYKKLEPVIHQTFDVPVMAKIAIGSEWTGFTADEKTRMLEAFAATWSRPTRRDSRSYKGQKFEVGEVKEPKENRMLVETKLIRSNGEPIVAQLPVSPGVRTATGRSSTSISAARFPRWRACAPTSPPP